MRPCACTEMWANHGMSIWARMYNPVGGSNLIYFFVSFQQTMITDVMRLKTSSNSISEIDICKCWHKNCCSSSSWFPISCPSATSATISTDSITQQGNYQLPVLTTYMYGYGYSVPKLTSHFPEWSMNYYSVLFHKLQVLLAWEGPFCVQETNDEPKHGLLSQCCVLLYPQQGYLLQHIHLWNVQHCPQAWGEQHCAWPMQVNWLSQWLLEEGQIFAHWTSFSELLWVYSWNISTKLQPYTTSSSLIPIVHIIQWCIHQQATLTSRKSVHQMLCTDKASLTFSTKPKIAPKARPNEPKPDIFKQPQAKPRGIVNLFA